MNKIVLQLIFSVALFFAMWFALSKIDWMTIFRVKQLTQSTESKLGDMFWDLYSKTEREIKSDKATLPLDSILTVICKSNHIDKTKIKLHIIQTDEVNAFALPNRHLIINSALITSCENEAELSGVICHELAHMELNHVMKKLIKEVGLSVLISITSGGGGSDKIREVVKLLSSSAYDRNLEKEADIKAVDYMKKANIDPEYFANFLFRLSNSEPNTLKYFSWISTHPNSQERSKYIITYSGKRNKTARNVLSEETWKNLKAFISEK